MPKKTPEQHSAEDALLSLADLYARYSDAIPRLLSRITHGTSLIDVCDGYGCPSYLGLSRLLMDAMGDSIPEIVEFRANFFIAQEASSRLHMDRMLKLADDADDKNKQGKVALQMKALLEYAERVSPMSFSKARRQFELSPSAAALADKLEDAFAMIQARHAARIAVESDAKKPAASLPSATRTP